MYPCQLCLLRVVSAAVVNALIAMYPICNVNVLCVDRYVQIYTISIFFAVLFFFSSMMAIFFNISQLSLY